MKQEKNYLRDGRAPIPEKEATSKVMSSIKDRDTKPELMIRKALWDEGLKGYRLHWKKVPGRPDIAYPGKKIAIFVNGCFWHRCPYCKPPVPKSHASFWDEKFAKNIERDKRKIEQLEDNSWKTLTIWECQIKKNALACVEKIKALLDK